MWQTPRPQAGNQPPPPLARAKTPPKSEVQIQNPDNALTFIVPCQPEVSPQLERPDQDDSQANSSGSGRTTQVLTATSDLVL